MNKYQEALLELGKYTVVLSWSKNQTCSIAELKEFKLLQELVDKATPKEPDKVIDTFCDDTWEYYFCPNCEKEVECENAVDDTPYCPFCGQALKWEGTK